MLRQAGESHSALRGSKGLLSNHPRIRGEYPLSGVTTSCGCGSPPRARGAPHPRRRIPPSTDHPRVRGEHRSRSRATCLVTPAAGSPPRARGARPQRRGHGHRPGITPACAGSTSRRSHGTAVSCGSPPRARGAHFFTRQFIDQPSRFSSLLLPTTIDTNPTDTARPPGGPQQTDSHCRIVLFRIKAPRFARHTTPTRLIRSRSVRSPLPPGEPSPSPARQPGGSRSPSGGPSEPGSKISTPLETVAWERSTMPPEKFASLKLTWPLERNAWVKGTWLPEKAAPAKTTPGSRNHAPAMRPGRLCGGVG